jgi:hypothetical protein
MKSKNHCWELIHEVWTWLKHVFIIHGSPSQFILESKTIIDTFHGMGRVLSQIATLSWDRQCSLILYINSLHASVCLVGSRDLRTLWGANATCRPLPFLSYREKGERWPSSGTRAGVGDSPGNTRALFRSTRGKELGLWPGTRVFVGRPGFVTDPV